MGFFLELLSGGRTEDCGPDSFSRNRDSERLARIEQKLDTLLAKLESSKADLDAEPVAWGVIKMHSKEMLSAHDDWHKAHEEELKYDFPTQLVGLFLAPPPPRGWLSDQERFIIPGVIDFLDAAGIQASAETLRGLLARVTDTEPRGWLTDEEREALRRAASVMAEEYQHGPTDNEAAAVLRGLLSRSSPPRVRHPAKRPHPESRERDSWWIKALAAAGVEVSNE